MGSAIYCPSCRLPQPLAHRYCARCGTSLPTELVAGAADAGSAKTFRFFAGIKVDDKDPENAYLRVSCYREDRTFTSPEGTVTIPGHHVRFSVWVDNMAVCVISLPEVEARELAGYLESDLDGLLDRVVS
ncbi:MAG: hypothetical protein ABR529_14380 [Actinomycetota bacterium]